MKRTLLTCLFLISSLFLSSSAFSAPQLKVFQVTHVKQGDSLNMRAWPSIKSRVVVALPHNAKWVASHRKPIKKGKSTWQKIHWNGNSGWVNTKYLKYDATNTYKARQRRNHRVKQEGHGSRNTTRSAATVRKRSSNKPTGKRVVMECGGAAPFWNISMNFTGKSLKVNLRDGTVFNSPLYYRKWLNKSNKMVVNGGRGRNAVRATLTKTNTCTDGITNIKYPFAVSATISGNKKVTGCCRSVQR